MPRSGRRRICKVLEDLCDTAVHPYWHAICVCVRVWVLWTRSSDTVHSFRDRSDLLVHLGRSLQRQIFLCIWLQERWNVGQLDYKIRVSVSIVSADFDPRNYAPQWVLFRLSPRHPTRRPFGQETDNTRHSFSLQPCASLPAFDPQLLHPLLFDFHLSDLVERGKGLGAWERSW